MLRRVFCGLLAVAALLLASGCCDQTCQCPSADASRTDAGVGVAKDPATDPTGRSAGTATANNSPSIDTLDLSLRGCAGAALAQTLQLTDPDGDEVTLTHEVTHSPQGANVKVTPAGPVTTPADGSVVVTVSCDLPGEVRLDYTVTDAHDLEGAGPYSVVLRFMDCTAGPADSGAADGGTADGGLSDASP